MKLCDTGELHLLHRDEDGFLYLTYADSWRPDMGGEDTNQVSCSVLQCVAVCCSLLQSVAVCCSLLQCIAGLI